MSKIHEIDGKKYVEVERKAEVGDYILCTSDGDQGGIFYRRWDIGKYLFSSETYPSIRVKFSDDLGGIRENGECYVGNDAYVVIEPVDETPSPELVDLIANLSAEVTQLKRNHAEQIDTLFRNTTLLAEELATLQTAEPVDNTPVTLPKWLIDRLMGGYRG